MDAGSSSSNGPGDDLPGDGRPGAGSGDALAGGASAPSRGSRSPIVSALAWLGFVALVVTHLLPADERVGLLGGWFPEELAWRLGWVAASAVYLILFCRFVWRREDRA